MGSVFSTEFPKYLNPVSLKTTPRIQQKFILDRIWCRKRKGLVFFIAAGILLFITIQIYIFIQNYKKLPDSKMQFIISCIILSTFVITAIVSFIIEKFFPTSIFRQRINHLCIFLLIIFGNSFNTKDTQTVPY